MIDNPAANRGIQQKKEKTHHFLFWRGAGSFRGFHLLLITDPAFGVLESDPVLNFTRKSSSNFPRCFKTCNWHDALMWYFVASSLVQVLVTVSVSLPPLSSSLPNLFKAPLLSYRGS